MQILVLDRTGKATTLADACNGNRAGFVALPEWSDSNRRRYGFAGWMLDPTTRLLIGPSDRSADLTSSEFDLLMAFLAQPGRPLSRPALLASLKGREWNYFDRSIDTTVARLRKKLDGRDGAAPLIRSVRGVGYVFCASVSRMG
jgi:two-component system, OmpR family, response regulator